MATSNVSAGHVLRLPEMERVPTHGLWVGNGNVLDIALGIDPIGCPPEREHLPALNCMIQGLARALKSVVYQAENDADQDSCFVLQPVEDIANAIVLLSQLSGAVQEEIDKATIR